MKKNWKSTLTFGLFALLPFSFAAAEESAPKPKIEERTAQASIPLPINRINEHINSTRKLIVESTQNNTDVLMEYDNLAKTLKSAYLANHAMNEGDIHIVLEAVGFASEKHKGQTRGQTPYVIHPIRVAHHLINVGNVNERDTLVSALIHNTVDETKVTFQEVEKSFGNAVVSCIREVTGKTLPGASKEMIASKAASQIMLAVNYDNIKSIQTESGIAADQKKIDEYFAKAKEITSNIKLENDSLKKAVEDVLAKHISTAEVKVEEKSVQ
jgi:hypothetical protein